MATTKNSLAAAEQQIQQLEAKLAQKISQDVANITVPTVKRLNLYCHWLLITLLLLFSKSKKVQKKKPADETTVSVVPITSDKGSSSDVVSVKDSETPSAFGK